MSDGIPKSRVTLTYDTKQPEGREKPRELPFRLMVMGDLGGSKDLPFEERKVRQLNGRNFGEVLKGLKVKVKDVDLGGTGRKIDVVIDSLKSFSPDEVLKLLTGQKESVELDASLKRAWDKKADDLFKGDEELKALWAKRVAVVSFMNKYQNDKKVRQALKRFSAPPTADNQVELKKELDELQTELGGAAPAGGAATGGSPTTGGTGQ